MCSNFIYFLNRQMIVAVMVINDYYRIWRLRFLIRRQSRSAFFFANGEVLFDFSFVDFY